MNVSTDALRAVDAPSGLNTATDRSRTAVSTASNTHAACISASMVLEGATTRITDADDRPTA
jgi:hypothetical protein